MACRFIEADDELIELLKCESENKNTKRSTGYWKGIFAMPSLSTNQRSVILPFFDEFNYYVMHCVGSRVRFLV